MQADSSESQIQSTDTDQVASSESEDGQNLQQSEGQEEPEAGVEDGSKVAQTKTEIDKKDDSGFDTFWDSLEEEFKNKQKGKGNDGLPWREDFKTILLSEQSGTGKWTATKQEWKDCQIKRKRDGQHVEAYCGYVEFSKGSDNYRMLVSYTWMKEQNKEKWDIRIVKGNGNNVKYYDGTEKNWKATSGGNGSCPSFFGGEENQSCNNWTRIEPASITK